MNKYKTYEELKEELGDKFEEYLYGANINLLTIIDELEKWLEEMLNELKQNDVYDRTSYEMGQIIATECIIAKIEELKGESNEHI